MEKTSMGLDENLAGLLTYALTWVSGLVFYLLETKNKFVRFHAMQSMIVFGAISIVSIVSFPIPFLGAVLSGLIGLAGFVLWIVLMIKAYQGTMYKLPVAGDLAEKWSGITTS